MEITVKRIARKKGYTIGRMYIAGQYVCDTLEDEDRGLSSVMPVRDILIKKIPGQTAIPTGTYNITMRVGSPKFGSKAFYRKVCGGCLPRLIDVPGYSGVLIHCGNSAADTDGCILVGENREVGRVLKSQETFTRLCKDYLLPASRRGEDITIKIG